MLSDADAVSVTGPAIDEPVAGLEILTTGGVVSVVGVGGMSMIGPLPTQGLLGSRVKSFVNGDDPVIALVYSGSPVAMSIFPDLVYPGFVPDL